jgi:hypothetical protein
MEALDLNESGINVLVESPLLVESLSLSMKTKPTPAKRQKSMEAQHLPPCDYVEQLRKWRFKVQERLFFFFFFFFFCASLL